MGLLIDIDSFIKENTLPEYQKISLQKADAVYITEKKASPKFSILLPSWNNLPYLKLCVAGIQTNSHFPHQVILHINEGTDNTLQWAKEQDVDFTHSEENIGICHAVNAASALVKTDYIVYMNDDMYVCPDWDKYLWAELQQLNTKKCFLSATMIEPENTGNPCVIAPHNYGTTVQEFDRQKLLETYNKLFKEDWSGATWPPNIVHKDLWDEVEGYSTEFSPGMYSDPDFSMKLWQAGVRIFKGIGKSRVYHFGATTSKKIKHNKGKQQFLKKWGIAPSTFTKYYLQRGGAYKGALTTPKGVGYGLAMLKDKVKKIL